MEYSSERTHVMERVVCRAVIGELSEAQLFSFVPITPKGVTLLLKMRVTKLPLPSL